MSEDDDVEDLEELTFEEALDRLQTIVDDLESGDLGLEEAMDAFEEGNELAEICRKRLDEAEGKLEELLEEDETVEFEVDEDTEE